MFSQGVTALHWAASSGSLDSVKVLVEHHANVNVLEKDGEKLSPLDYAIIGDGIGNSYSSIVTYLTSHGGLSVTEIRIAAAIAIQSAYRGYSARKRVRIIKATRIQASSALPGLSFRID
jgi:hypothetical protein